MTRYRSNAWARATVKKFAETTGLEIPDPSLLDHWGDQYERFLWISQSNNEGWLRTLIKAVETDQPLEIKDPDKVLAWLKQETGSKPLPIDLVKTLATHLEHNPSGRSAASKAWNTRRSLRSA